MGGRRGERGREETELYVPALQFGILSCREQRFLTSLHLFPLHSSVMSAMVVNSGTYYHVGVWCSISPDPVAFLVGKYLGPGSLRFDFCQIVKDKLSTGSGFTAEFSLVR
jgi:hypothetical protein